jgi:hypothetical protein
VSNALDHAKDAAHSVVEAAKAAPGEIVATAREIADDHPAIRRGWQRVGPILKFSLAGAAFVGGGLLLARWFGGSTARSLGREGGEGFARGVNEMNEAIAKATGGRGSRFG